MEYSESLRQDYIRGADKNALCEKYCLDDAALAALVRCGGWKGEREIFRWRQKNIPERLKNHLALTDRMVTLVSAALEDERQLYKYTAKDGACRENEALDTDRLEKLTKSVQLLLQMQRDILGIPVFKEAADERTDERKLHNDREAAAKKLELELLKLDGGGGGAIPEGLMEAIRGDE